MVFGCRLNHHTSMKLEDNYFSMFTKNVDNWTPESWGNNQ